MRSVRSREILQILSGAGVGLLLMRAAPGHHGPGLGVAALLAAAGAILAEWGGVRLRLYRPGRPAGLAMAVLGAVATVLLAGVAWH